MKSLAIGIMMWMQANCNVPAIHPSQNFCNMNFDLPIPKIVMMSQRQIVKEFQERNGIMPQGKNSIRGFYYEEVIYIPDDEKVEDAGYNDVIFKSVQDMRNNPEPIPAS